VAASWLEEEGDAGTRGRGDAGRNVPPVAASPSPSPRLVLSCWSHSLVVLEIGSEGYRLLTYGSPRTTPYAVPALLTELRPGLYPVEVHGRPGACSLRTAAREPSDRPGNCPSRGHRQSCHLMRQASPRGSARGFARSRGVDVTACTLWKIRAGATLQQ